MKSETMRLDFNLTFREIMACVVWGKHTLNEHRVPCIEYY